MSWLKPIAARKPKPKPRKPTPEGAQPPKRRRPRGTGTLYQLPNGWWRARHRRDGFNHTKDFPTWDEASAWLDNKRKWLDTFEPATANMVIGAYLDKWLEYQRPLVRRMTLKNYGHCVERIKTFYGDKPLEQISPEDVRKLQLWLLERGYAGSSQRQTRNILQYAMEQAVDDGIINRNPAAKVKAPRGGARRDTRVWTQKQVLTFSQKLKGHRLELLVTLLLETGLRIGEALALTWDDVIDWRKIHVRRSIEAMNDENGQPRFTEGKTKAARRYLLISRSLGEKLREHYLSPREFESRIVFATKSGKHLSRHNFRRDLELLCKKFGVPYISPHELRHTYTTLAHQAGISTKVTASRLGHTTTRMTDHYNQIHQVESEQANAALSLEQLLKSHP
jgi:integrase